MQAHEPVFSPPANGKGRAGGRPPTAPSAFALIFWPPEPWHTSPIGKAEASSNPPVQEVRWIGPSPRVNPPGPRGHPHRQHRPHQPPPPTRGSPGPLPKSGTCHRRPGSRPRFAAASGSVSLRPEQLETRPRTSPSTPGHPATAAPPPLQNRHAPRQRPPSLSDPAQAQEQVRRGRPQQQWRTSQSTYPARRNITRHSIIAPTTITRSPNTPRPAPQTENGNRQPGCTALCGTPHARAAPARAAE